MKASELRARSPEDLTKLVRDLQREYFNLKLQRSMGQLTKHDKFRHVRRDIARVLTVLSEKRR